MTSKESMDKLDEQIKEFQEEAENYNEMLEESVEDNEDHTKEFTNEEEEYVEEETTKEFDKEEFEEQEKQEQEEKEEIKEEPKEEEKKEEDKEEPKTEEKPEEKKKMPKNKKIIISLIVLIVLALALIIALIISMNKKEEVIEVEKEEEYSAKALNKILNNYGKSIENVIAINQSSDEKLLDFEEANKLVDFPNKVVCKTHEVYEDGKIFLKDCKIDGHSTKATYGKKQEVKEEVKVEEGSFYVYEKDGTATLDEPKNPDEYKRYLVTTNTTPTEITLLNKYNAKYVFYFDEEQKVQMKNFKTNKNAVVVQGVDSVLPIKNENGFDTVYIGISNGDSWGIYNLNTGMTEVPLKYIAFTDHLSLGVYGPSLYVNSLTDNNIAVRDKDNRIGVINYKTGVEVIPLDYGSMLKSGNYLWKTVIEKDNYDNVLSTAIYDFDGNKYLDDKYDEVYGIVSGKYILVKDKKDIKLVLIDGKELYNYGEIKNLGNLHYSISYNENPLFQLNKKDRNPYDEKNCIEVTYDLKTKTGSYKDYTCGGIAKPILYLYPTEQTNVKVTFDHPEFLKTTYPKYKGSWDVTVKEDGTITDKDGRNYYALYWDEEQVHKTNFKTGFYVESKDAIKFLEEKLYEIGLTDREANEFIMYWLPKLEDNKKSLVYFELTKERDSYNKINIDPKPDSLLRLTIHIKKVKKETKIKEQKLTPFVRDGFTAVEWGGVTY